MIIRRGDILWADLGMFPITSVQGGVRPVIVVSNNKANTYSSVITVVPLTSRIYKKRYLPTHVFISKYDMTGDLYCSRKLQGFLGFLGSIRKIFDIGWFFDACKVIRFLTVICFL